MEALSLSAWRPARGRRILNKGFVSCSLCCQRVSTCRLPLLKDFLQTKCPPKLYRKSCRPQHCKAPISINSRQSHPSHNLATHRDVLCCSKCGFHAQFVLRKLVSVCKGKPFVASKLQTFWYLSACKSKSTMSPVWPLRPLSQACATRRACC